MPKFEYAAIVCDGTERIHIGGGASGDFPRWALVKPGKDPYTVSSEKKPHGKKYIFDSGDSWKNPYEYSSRRSSLEATGHEYNDSEPEILFEANDMLTLVNLAGAHGWEITSCSVFSNGSPENHAISCRIMRREL